jgi:hypothetical protein
VLAQLVALALVASPAPAAVLAAAKSSGSGGERRMVNRVLRFTDESRTSVPEIHVGQRLFTVLIFPQDVSEKGTRLGDSQKLLYPLQIEKNVVTMSLAKSREKVEVPLTVRLVDGTLLAFVVTTVPDQVDLQVTVEVAFKANNAPESVGSLQAAISDLQARLDECQATNGAGGVSQIAQLVLLQQPQSPQARTFEGYPAKGADKQSRLLVRLQHLYRLFGESYLLLTIENRDPSRTWVPERADVKLLGGPDSQTVKVVAWDMATDADTKSLLPQRTGKIVVAFSTPAQVSGQKYSLSLVEKGGSRHVTMEFEP